MPNHRWLVVVCGFGLAGPLLADIVHLKDGGTLEGDVRRTDDGWTLYAPGQSPLKIPPDKVQSIELTASKSNDPRVSAERLSSLRNSVDTLRDPKDAIARYTRFIDQNKDPAVDVDAKKDLAIWHERLDRKMVHVGSKWILPDGLGKLAEESVMLADQARQLMKQGRTKEAEPMLVEATTDDANNPTALYLLGLLRYQQEKIPEARKAFDAVNQLTLNHAPTLNNLAVVLWRQRQYIASLMKYDEAMLSSPVNRDILDNVSTALNFLPSEFRNGPITQRVTRHFTEQDKSLQEQMARSGWHRYGGMWVTDHDIADIKQQEKENQAKLDAMAGDFEKLKQQVAQIDRSIQDTESTMRRIEAQSYVRDPNTGAIFQVAYPPVYFDLQRDDARYRQDKAIAVGKMDQLTASAKALQKQLPAQRVSDIQKVIGPEGTPISARKPAATMPTTLP